MKPKITLPILLFTFIWFHSLHGQTVPSASAVKIPESLKMTSGISLGVRDRNAQLSSMYQIYSFLLSLIAK